MTSCCGGGGGVNTLSVELGVPAYTGVGHSLVAKLDHELEAGLWADDHDPDPMLLGAGIGTTGTAGAGRFGEAPTYCCCCIRCCCCMLSNIWAFILFWFALCFFFNFFSLLSSFLRSSSGVRVELELERVMSITAGSAGFCMSCCGSSFISTSFLW